MSQVVANVSSSGSTPARNEQEMANSCLVAECEKKVIARSLCQAHYDRKRRYGDLNTRPLTGVCVQCQQEFPIKTTGNISLFCDSCAKERHSEMMRKDRWRKGLKEGYGITPADYDLMFEVQNGLCAICGHPPIYGRGAKNNRLSVDHDHETGKVRALLCSKCNTGIGLLNDDIELLAKAIEYITHHKKGK
jgi:hypothetical protein